MKPKLTGAPMTIQEFAALQLAIRTEELDACADVMPEAIVAQRLLAIVQEYIEIRWNNAFASTESVERAIQRIPAPLVPCDHSPPPPAIPELEPPQQKGANA